MSTDDLDDLAGKVDELGRKTHETAVEMGYLKKALEAHTASTDKRFDSISEKLDGLVTGQNTMAVNIAAGKWGATEMAGAGTLLGILMSGLASLAYAVTGHEPKVTPPPPDPPSIQADQRETP